METGQAHATRVANLGMRKGQVSEMAGRLFAPAVMFVGARVSVEELAEHLKVYVKEWLPDGQPHLTSYDSSEDAQVVSFPMAAAEFVSSGVMLMECLHGACRGETEDSANEFLACYPDYAPGADPTGPAEAAPVDQAPARGMFAALFISDDGGLSWWDEPYLQLRRARQGPAASQ